MATGYINLKELLLTSTLHGDGSDRSGKILRWFVQMIARWIRMVKQ